MNVIDNRPSLAVEQQLLSRLDEGAGQPVLFLPFLGEFGHEVMTHLRIVHFNRASEKIVCCRPGCEVLYPSATAYVTDWQDPVADHRRARTMRSRADMWPELVARFPGHMPLRSGQLGMEHELVAIRPEVRLPLRPKLRGLRADVVLGVRRRTLCVQRNWRHWRKVAVALNAAGVSFAVVGVRATSFDLPGQACHTGDLDTDAAVELMQSCRLFIGSDTGSAHLASTVGCQMLVFREFEAPERDFVKRMAEVNPGRVHFAPSGWRSPQIVIESALKLLK